MASVNRRLRIALLSYRSKPHSGGQGVYVRHLSRELAALGHHVEVFSGQPYPELDDGPLLRPVPSLDLYRDDDPFRTPRPAEIRDWADALEVAMMWGGAFPEPLTFSIRALRALRARPGEFDIVHDNQGLGYGMLGVRRLGLPLVTSIHHPITVDRRLDLADRGWLERLNKARWYGFVRMQGRVSRRVGPLITVSESSRDDICRDFKVPTDKVRIIPLGVDTRLFRPRPQQPRVKGRIVTVTSADSPLKGLSTLLRAVAKLATERDARLVVVGTPSSATREQVALLALGDRVTFTNGLPDEEYARAARLGRGRGDPVPVRGVLAAGGGAPRLGDPAGRQPGRGAARGRRGRRGAGRAGRPGGARRRAARAARRRYAAGELAARGLARVRERFAWPAVATATVGLYLNAINGELGC